MGWPQDKAAQGKHKVSTVLHVKHTVSYRIVSNLGDLPRKQGRGTEAGAVLKIFQGVNHQ